MKRFLSILLAILMLAVMLPVTAMAADGYVTVTITYNGEFSNKYQDAVTAAEAAINRQYSTLKAAQDAFAALFADKAALFTMWNDSIKTVDKVTYSVYGAVGAGTDNITLSAGPRNKVSVDLLGYDNAKINGKVSIWADVAGGYPTWTIDEGTFNVKNIEFTDNVSISMSGGMYNGDTTATTDKMNITGCTFRARLYTYHNDPATTRIENITNNTFINDGTTGYAYMHQGSDFRGTANTVNFKNNTVTGYTRGINLQSNKTDFVVDNNTITSTNSESNRGAVQLTDAKTCAVTNNTIDVNGGNAIFFHEAATNKDASYTINNNKIKAPYLIYNNTALTENNIQSQGNTLDIANPGKAMTKETGAIDSTTIINGTMVQHPIIIYTPDSSQVFLSGANQTVAPGSAATFRIDKEFSELQSVAVDGVTLDKSNYKAWSGSTYVELTASYMKTLAVGTHTLSVYFTGDTATTTFTISKDATKNPTTGANDFVGIAAAAAVVALLGSAVILRKK